MPYQIPEQQMVLEFHEKFNCPVGKGPTIIEQPVIESRLRLIREELMELDLALTQKDLVETADALADLLYVVYGTAVACGIDMGPIFAEVHRANMTRVGGTMNEYGKLVKPSTYDPPKLLELVRDQLGWQ